MAILPGAWRYRVSTGTGRPGVSILWLSEVERLICNFYLSVASRKLVWADPSLRYTSLLLGRLATNQQTNKPLAVKPHVVIPKPWNILDVRCSTKTFMVSLFWLSHHMSKRYSLESFNTIFLIPKHNGDDNYSVSPFVAISHTDVLQPLNSHKSLFYQNIF